MICSNGKNILISCNEQIINRSNSRIKQIGTNFGKFEKYKEELKVLANNISSNYSGLFGYIGVDVVFEDNIWKVIEINTRFTSSYVGIERSYGKKLNKEIVKFYINKDLESFVNPICKLKRKQLFK